FALLLLLLQPFGFASCPALFIFNEPLLFRFFSGLTRFFFQSLALFGFGACLFFKLAAALGFLGGNARKVFQLLLEQSAFLGSFLRLLLNLTAQQRGFARRLQRLFFQHVVLFSLFPGDPFQFLLELQSFDLGIRFALFFHLFERLQFFAGGAGMRFKLLPF